MVRLNLRKTSEFSSSVDNPENTDDEAEYFQGTPPILKDQGPDFDLATEVQKLIDTLAEETAEEERQKALEEERKANARPQAVLKQFFEKHSTKMTYFFSAVIVLTLLGPVIETIIGIWSHPQRKVILRSPTATPFFPPNTSHLVQDYYSGNVRTSKFPKESDLSIVMFYAKWSIESKELVPIMLNLANYYNTKNRKSIKFSAVNCWAPGSHCRETYKLHVFPIIMAYSGTISLPYQGPLDFDTIHRWIYRIMNPYIHITSIEHFTEIRSLYDTVAVGYFPFKNSLPITGFRDFVAAGVLLNNGLMSSERTAVCVITDVHLAIKLFFGFEGDIYLYSNSEKVNQWPVGPRTAESIRDWIQNANKADSDVNWIETDRVNQLASDDFAQILNDTAVIILAVNVFPLYQPTHEISVFRQIAKEYWQCGTHIQSIIDYPKSEINYEEQQFREDEQLCLQTRIFSEYTDPCCRSFFEEVDWNFACASQARHKWEFEDMKSEENGSRRRNHWTEQYLPMKNECLPLKEQDAQKVIESCCLVYEQIRNPLLSTQQRELEKQTSQHKSVLQRDACGRYTQYMNFKVRPFFILPPILFIFYKFKLRARVEFLNLFDENAPSVNDSLVSFGCEKNDTLKFMLLDMTRNGHLLQKLGIRTDEDSKIIIVDTYREFIGTMDEEITQKNIRKYIRDYHANNVDYHMLSEGETNSRFTNQTIQNVTFNSRIIGNSSLIQLDSYTFTELLDDKNLTSDSLVFFSGGLNDAMSTSVLHSIHQSMHYFKGSEDLLKFYIIDCSRNDLPYTYNFDRFPSIVLFPAASKDISWLYPYSLPITTTNIITFITSNSSPLLKWRILLNTCDTSCLVKNISRLRQHSIDIRRELRLYVDSQKDASERERLLQNLNFIRQLIIFMEKASTESTFPSKDLLKLVSSPLFATFTDSMLE